MNTENEILKVVKRKNASVRVEMEVVEEAINSYVKYPCYKEENGWKICGSEHEKRSQVTSKGLYLSKNREDSEIFFLDMSADILTSIKAPINAILKLEKKPILNKKITGIMIVERIEKDFENIDISRELQPYVKAFARVYYTPGNMMPVPEKGNPALGNADNVINKFLILEEIFNSEIEKSIVQEIDALIQEEHSIIRYRGYKKIWKYWVAKEWKNKSFNKFVEDNFLQDVRELKKINNNPKNTEDWKKWFIFYTKFIIQRNCRIKCSEYYKEGEITSEGEEKVKSLFEDVFKEIETADFKLI